MGVRYLWVRRLCNSSFVRVGHEMRSRVALAGGNKLRVTIIDLVAEGPVTSLFFRVQKSMSR